MFTDFILNGEGHGVVGGRLQEARFEPGLLRPYFNDDGHKAVTVNTGRKVRQQYTDKAGVKRTRVVNERTEVLCKDLRDDGLELPVHNATTLQKDQWIEFDRAVVKAARQRLRAWADLAAASTINVNGMGKTTFEYQAMSDPGEAVQDMDTLADGRGDNPLFALSSVPLPITHSDFYFSARRIAVSRSDGREGVDTIMAEAAGRRVAELIEKQVIGVETGMTYGPTSTSDTRYRGTSKVYGYTNFPNRITKTDLTTPTGTNADDVFTDVIEMREQMYALGYYGPFMLYHTPGYDAYLDRFFTVGTAAQGLAAPSQSLRSAVAGIDGIAGVRRLDYWTGSTYQMVLVQMGQDVASAINGMDLTTVQWDSQGGLRKNFKVMAIWVPLLKYEYNGNSGVLHATTS